MIAENKIQNLVEDKLKGSDKFLVEVKISPANKIMVLIDSDKGIQIQDCVELSRYLENSLQRDVEDFELEVSSPGLDRPLKLPRQFIKNIGRKLDYKTHSGQKGTALLVSADSEGITLEEKQREQIPGKKGKKMVTRQWELGYNEIKEAKIHIMFKN